jgi:serine/threonine-protein kinase
MLNPGDPFDHFTIEAELGHGGMGSVYRAHDARLQRRVALKVLRAAPDATPAEWADAKARILREARAAAALEHPNAVSIFELGEVNGEPFIAMELVIGTTFRSHVGNAEVPWPRKLRWLLDAASALGAAHTAGLVHRDVKPENLMVGDNGRVKVLDFGIARRAVARVDVEGRTQPDGALPTLTGKGQIVGTPQYMPPELLLGQPIDGRADQFAWAATAFELLTGRLPWASQGDAVALIASILTQPAAPARSVAPDLPAEVEAVLARALSKSAGERFASMDEVIDLLEPLASAAPSLSSLPRRPVSSRPGPSQPSWPTPAPVASSAPSTPAAPRSARRWIWGVAGACAIAGVGVAAFARARAHEAKVVAAAPSASTAKPDSDNAAAVAAYQAGLQALHDAAYGAADRHFNRALALDPGLGAAHLRLALLSFLRAPLVARKHYASAVDLRARLSEREKALLDAFAPALQGEPPDYAEAARRIDAASAKAPDDADLAILSAAEHFLVGDARAAGAAVDRALALDAKYPLAWLYKSYVATSEGRAEDAFAAIGHCLEAAPSATQCLRRRVLIEKDGGDCEAFERDAKQWVAIDHESADAYNHLAQAAFARGKPVDAVREMLKQSWGRIPEADRHRTELVDLARLQIATGDFSAAARGLRELETVVADRPEQMDHAVVAWTTSKLLAEQGETARAGKTADDFLRRRDAWVAQPALVDSAIANDLTPSMLLFTRRAGLVSAADFAAKRDDWARALDARVPHGYRGYVWIYGYAAASDSPIAADAMVALPRYEPLPTFRPFMIGNAHIGHALLLAGRAPEATSLLRRAATSCQAFEDPFVWTESQLWLGQAFEATEDVAAACAAYATVVTRWGAAPKSKTAAQARTRAAALRCDHSR